MRALHFLAAYLFIFSLMVGCAQHTGPAEENQNGPAKGIQEGIGGDIAAFYVKSVTAASLPASLRQIESDYAEVESAIREVRIHSASNLGKLFVHKDDEMKEIWVDQDLLPKQHVCVVASKFLQALNLPGLGFKRHRCTTVESFLELQRHTHVEQSLQDFANELSRKTRKNAALYTRYLRAAHYYLLAKDFAKAVEEVAAATTVTVTEDTLLDATSKVPVDAITKIGESKIEVLTRRDGQLTQPFYAPIKNLFLLHELNHAKNPEELPDRKYEISQELFSIWLNTRM